MSDHDVVGLEIMGHSPGFRFESSQFFASSKNKQQVWRRNTWQLFVHAVEQRLV